MTKLSRLCALVALSSSVSVSALHAADYYVQALVPGPVQGAPLGVVNLQADLNADAGADVNVDNDTGIDTGIDTGTDSIVMPDGSSDSADAAVIDGGDGSAGEISADTGATETAAAPESPPETGPVGKSAAARKAVKTKGKRTTDVGPSTETPVTTTVVTDGGSPPAPAPAPTPAAPTPAMTASTAAGTYQDLRTLFAAKVLVGGDRVFLQAGYHGPIYLSGLNFSTPVTFAPAPGEVAHADLIDIQNSSNIVFDGLKVWARSTNAGTIAMVRTYSNASNITFQNMDIRSVADAAKYMTWNLTDWTRTARGAFLLDGDKMSVVNNRLTGMANVIFSLGPNALIQGNVIDGWGNDGMRALGNNAVVRGNKLQNCFHISGNHDDGLQSFSRGAGGTVGTGTVSNLTIEGNKIYEWHTTQTNPLRCNLQGIGMFDGMFNGVVIRNNVISVSAYHGIAIAGALNAVIANNTVVSPAGAATGYPWIKITPHKNGTPSKGVTVANNTTNAVKVTTNAAYNIVVTNNVVPKNFTTEFTAPAQGVYTLVATAKSTNAGLAKYAPLTDIAGASRPKGAAPDAGAYESQ